MKRTCTAVALVLGLALPATGDTYPARTTGVPFLVDNPGYKQRAGAFYEQKYLPGAARALAEAVNHKNLKEEAATAVLRSLIYNFLDAYIQAEGQPTWAERVKVVEGVDKVVRDTLGDKAAYDRYLAWRKTTSREENPLEFLFNAPTPTLPRLPEKMAQAGWTMTVTDASTSVEAYKDYFGLAPDFVLVFENKKVTGKGTGHAAVRLLVYPARRLTLALAGREIPTAPFVPPGNDKLRPVQPFWQADSYVFFMTEGEFPAEQGQLATALRYQMLR